MTFFVNPFNFSELDFKEITLIIFTLLIVFLNVYTFFQYVWNLGSGMRFLIVQSIWLGFGFLVLAGQRNSTNKSEFWSWLNFIFIMIFYIYIIFSLVVHLLAQRKEIAEASWVSWLSGGLGTRVFPLFLLTKAFIEQAKWATFPDRHQIVRVHVKPPADGDVRTAW